MRPGKTTVYTGLGHQFILSCSVFAWPRAEVTWSRHHRTIRDSARLTTRLKGDTHYLFVYNVTDTDFGEYVCSASNRLGVERQNIVVVGERVVLSVPVTMIRSCLGSPAAPTVSQVVRLNQETHKVSWTTESFTPLTHHRILIKDVSYFLIFFLSLEITFALHCSTPLTMEQQPVGEY